MAFTRCATGTPVAMRDGFGITRRDILAGAAAGAAAVSVPRLAFAGEPQGQLTWAIHVSLAPTWFDPAETPGILTPFMVLYALHDGMVKPMPGNMATPSLVSLHRRIDGLIVTGAEGR